MLPSPATVFRQSYMEHRHESGMAGYEVNILKTATDNSDRSTKEQNGRGLSIWKVHTVAITDKKKTCLKLLLTQPETDHLYCC